MTDNHRRWSPVENAEEFWDDMTAALTAADDQHRQAMEAADEAEQVMVEVAETLAELDQVYRDDPVWGAYGYGTGYKRAVANIVADRIRETADDETSPWIYTYALLVVSYRADGTPSKRQPTRWTAWTKTEGGDRQPRLGVALRPDGPHLVHTIKD